MAISLKHNFTSAVADEGDTSLVRPSNWNAEHDLTLATSRLVGRTTAGTGSAEEISVGTGLNLSSGSLAVSSTTPQVNSINTFTAAQVIETTDNSNPALRITQLGTADALRIEDETSPDSTPFVVTAAGHAIAGYGSALTIQTVVPQFQSHTATLDEGGFGGVDWGNTATGQVNWFGKSRGGSYGVQTIVQSGDVVGDTRFYGSDGVGLIPTAKIEVAIDGTPGVNDMPGRISMYTTADGSSSVSERMRITSAGNVGIGTTAPSGRLEVLGGVVNSISNLGAGDAASLVVTNSDVSGLGRISKTLYEIGNLPVAAVAAVYSAFNAGGDIGGDLVFGTQTNLAGGVVERLRINKDGAFGIAGANYGTSGQSLVSGGSSAAPSWGTLGINGGGTGQTTAPAAINALTGYLTIVSAAGTTTLTSSSAQTIYVSGTSTQTIVLPAVTTLQLGWTFVVFNGSTNNVTVQSSGLNSFTAIGAGQTARFVCIAVTGTTTASWVVTYEGASTRTGTGSIVYTVNPALFGPTINNARYTLETITAGTNAQNQGAIASSTEIAVVTTTANNPSGVTLNTAAAGKRTTVFNLGTNPIVVYPLSGTAINGLAANAGVTIPVGYSLLFEAQTATQWRTQNLGTSGQVLTSGGSSTAPSWATPSASAASGMFWENDLTLTTNYTITTNKNAGTFGPVTINSGVTVTVPSGSTWTIV